MSMKFLVLGGYGNTGRALCRLLLQESNAHVVIAGRQFDQAVTFAVELAKQFSSDRMIPMQIDAANADELDRAFQQVDCVVVASSTVEYTKIIAEAALRAHIDYFDCQVSPLKLDALQVLQPSIQQSNCCFISDCGFHSGLPADLVRYAAIHFDQLDVANVASVIKLDWQSLELSDSTIAEKVDEMQHCQSQFYQNGEWRQGKWTDAKAFYVDEEFGEQFCVPMLLEEMKYLPQQIPSLRETGFFIGGFNWFLDYVVFPLGAAALQIHPKSATLLSQYLMSWELMTFGHLPYHTVLLLEASGWKDQQFRTLRLQLSDNDGYFMTAASAIACLQQYLDSHTKNGFWLQAHFVETNRLLKDLQRLGIAIEMDWMPAETANPTNSDRWRKGASYVK